MEGSPNKEKPWSSVEIQVIKNSNFEKSKQSSLEAIKKFEFQVCDKVAIWSDLDKLVKIKSVHAKSSRKPLQRISWSEESEDFFIVKEFTEIVTHKLIQILTIWLQISPS